MHTQETNIYNIKKLFKNTLQVYIHSIAQSYQLNVVLEQHHEVYLFGEH